MQQMMMNKLSLIDCLSLKLFNSFNKCNKFLGGFKTRKFSIESVLPEDWLLNRQKEFAII